ncbi:MAG: hypothetical protein ACTSRL_03170 [Candidatus Helarchaeota archaeon]
MSQARAILLEVGGMGMIREIMFKQNYIQDPRRATILVDEINGVLWVWLGGDVNMKTRKAIMPVAEKILAERGYKAKTDGHHVGQNVSQIIIIDQKNLGDPGVQQRHQTALNLFNMPYLEDGRFVVQFQTGAQAAVPAGGDPHSVALAGILIASILNESPEIFVGRTSQGIYTIETSQGNIKFQIKDKTVQLMPGSIGLNDNVQRIFQDTIRILK